MVRSIYVGRWDAGQCLVRDVRRIETPEGEFTHPMLSPDGRRVAFWGVSGGRACLWIAGVGDRTLECLHDLEGASMHPAWSPDSNALAYSSRPDFQGDPADGSLYNATRFAPRELRVLNLNDGTVRSVVPAETDNERPSWAPDGSRLLFIATRNGVTTLQTVDVATGERQVLGQDQGIHYYRPVWHPEGGHIAFNNKGPGPHWIWCIDSNGANLRRLSPAAPPRTQQWDHGSFWSADARQLLFHSNRSGVPGLWVMTASGGSLRQIKIPGFEAYAAHGTWDQAGKRIAFDSTKPIE